MIRHLFVPGLLGPMPGVEHAERPALPELERLLARADRAVEPRGYPGGLFALFGIDIPSDTDMPTAAVSLLGDSGEAATGCLLHADPLQLLADRDRLLAFDMDDDPLDADELAELVEAFNAHFVDDGLRLYASPGGHLYLFCERPPMIRTRPLSTVVGRSLDPCLPDGEERRRWRGLLNESQMLCHALTLNHAREAQGRPMLGGLWFSGGGSLPPAGEGPVARVVGECVLARGLLALRSAGGGDELVVEHGPGRAVMRADPGAWIGAVVALEARLPGLLQDCEALHLHPGNGTVYRWQPRQAWRVWRRMRPLFDRLDASRESPRGPGPDKGV